MADLRLHLPPFASDYSGVCATLFDLDCLTIVNDASCCTSNYVFYDEPRWRASSKTTFSTRLKNIDAVYGNDQRVIDNVLAAARALQPELVAVVGTPVPAIIGMDTRGIAEEVEAGIERPTFGFDTTGFSYYDKGITATAKALFDQYADTGASEPGHVNLVGMTPLDLDDSSNAADFRNLLSSNNLKVNGSYFTGTSLAEIRRAGSAEVNLAVTAAGARIAKYLHQRFATPYVCACPMGEQHAYTVLQRLQGVQLREMPPEITPSSEARGQALLLVMDQVMGSSLREALWMAGYPQQIHVGSFFGWDDDLALANDVHLTRERSLIDLAESGRYRGWVGDPYLALVPALGELPHVGLVHPAVSGKPKWGEVPSLLSPEFDELLVLMLEL